MTRQVATPQDAGRHGGQQQDGQDGRRGRRAPTPHPLYRKIVRTTKHYKAHDPHNEAVLGDVVRIEETRPISKDKRWRIAETLTRGNVADIAPRDIGAPEKRV